MYFVTLCTTTSAPRDSGCCSAGEANVLSTTTRTPAAWASADTAAMSTIFSSGLEGVSIQTNRVRGRIAAARPRRGRSGRTSSTSRPHGPNTFGEQPVRAPVDVVGEHHVVARP